MSAPVFTIAQAESREAVQRCHPVMVQLRPHLSLSDFTDQVQRQQLAGYRLAYAEREGSIVAVAGYRLQENLSWGRFLYIDDLVTDEAQRSTGAGSALFDHLVQVARDNGCQQLHLLSGVQRFGAHRFYLAKRMNIASHHFAMKLGKAPRPLTSLPAPLQSLSRPRHRWARYRARCAEGVCHRDR